jgi:hypothetical protein
MALYTVAGVNGQVELPVPLIVHLLPPSREKRPGTKRGTPGAWVQHETGNYNIGAGAAMHDRWLHNLTGTYLSFHFCVDDKVIYQFVPVDEITYQAADGAGPGNMEGVSCELCVNQDSDWTKARHNAEALAAAVCKPLGITRITRHYDYNEGDPDRHYCPKEMMSEGYWPMFVSHVQNLMQGTAQPMTAYPTGMDAGVAEYLFGPQFNPNGPVSKRWLDRGKALGVWPKLAEIKKFDDRTYYVFADGWTLWKPATGGVRELK